MLIKKSQIPLVITNLLLVTAFGLYYLVTKNYEFMIHIVVILFFFGLILLSNKKVNYSNGTLWGLSTWGFLHMAGGSFYIGGTKLYSLMLVPLHEEFQIFKYDQLVHVFGFAVATFVMFEILLPHLKTPIKKWSGILIVIIMASCGAGALNEIVEFTATVLVPETGVGGYVNNSLDLVFNLIGSIIAGLILKFRHQKHELNHSKKK